MLYELKAERFEMNPKQFERAKTINAKLRQKKKEEKLEEEKKNTIYLIHYSNNN